MQSSTGRRPMRPLLICLSLFAFAHVSTASAQDFTVRLIDVRNGRPFPGQTVTVVYRETVGTAVYFKSFTIKTDASGIASCRLPTPAPAKVSFATYYLYPCYDLQPSDTQQLRESGLATHCSKPSQGCHCKFSNEAAKVTPKPGEVVLLARPKTRWEKFLEHILD